MSILDAIRGGSAEPTRRAVLYVEDSVADATLVCGIFASVGVETDVVDGGRERVEQMMRDGEYLALFVDQVLPKERGLRIVRDLRDSGMPLPPTYIVSGSGEEELDLRAIMSGADGYIEKGSRGFRERLLGAAGTETAQV